MNRRHVTSSQADEDLIAIWVEIALDNPTSADRLLDRFEEAFTRLAEFPEMGVSREAVRPGLRSFPIGNYLIFYRPTDDGVEILRVLHGARQWQDLF